MKLQLKSKNKRLLNTEKIIFKAEGSNPVSVDLSSNAMS